MKRLGFLVCFLMGFVSMVQVNATTPVFQKDVHVQHLVSQVVEHYEEHGAQATIDKLNAGWTLDGEFYVFIDSAIDGTIVAHAATPALVGTTASTLINSEGRYVLQEIITTATEEGAWLEYMWPNPATGMDTIKRSWLVRVDDYVIGSGYYQ